MFTQGVNNTRKNGRTSDSLKICLHSALLNRRFIMKYTRTQTSILNSKLLFNLDWNFEKTIKIVQNLLELFFKKSRSSSTKTRHYFRNFLSNFRKLYLKRFTRQSMLTHYSDGISMPLVVLLHTKVRIVFRLKLL